MNSRRKFLRTASGAVGGYVFATAADAGAKTVGSGSRARGPMVLHGAGAPSRRLGIAGDFYVDARAHAIYGPKRATGWGRPTSLVGPAGPAGPTGATGPAGAAGGSSGPNNDGLVGATLADLTVITSANSGYAQTSGTLYMNACRVSAAAAKIAFEVDSAGSGLTAGQNLIGIYDTGGNLVMSTGDLSGYWSSGPSANIVVVDLPRALAPGFYYVGVLMNYSGTHPFLTGARCPMISEIGTRFAAVPRSCYSTSTSYSALPSSVSWSGGGFTANPWPFVTFIGFLP